MSARASRRVSWWGVVQGLLLLATLLWAGRALSAQWEALRLAATTLQIHWGWVMLASAIVLGTYAMLIGAWRLLLAGWGSDLRFLPAVRIWTIANLGRYLPGKVWSVGALGLLASREGVSGPAAAGAAILGTLLNIGAGFGVLALSGARVLGVFRPWLQSVALAVSVAFLVGTALLPTVLPLFLRRFAAWRGQPTITQQLPARTLWLATGINMLSWLCYGLAFAALARGVTPQVAAQPALFVVVWTASYLSGYLVLLVPGGIGVREVVMSGGLVALGLAHPADATLLALASRLWLTVWELLPGLLALGVSPETLRAVSRSATDLSR
ncbi:MAG: lysylphosphatidylglycerol synthase domain-containing protein [Gemmatimonadaceae bacterium]